MDAGKIYLHNDRWVIQTGGRHSQMNCAFPLRTSEFLERHDPMVVLSTGDREFTAWSSRTWQVARFPTRVHWHRLLRIVYKLFGVCVNSQQHDHRSERRVSFNVDTRVCTADSIQFTSSVYKCSRLYSSVSYFLLYTPSSHYLRIIRSYRSLLPQPQTGTSLWWFHQISSLTTYSLKWSHIELRSSAYQITTFHQLYLILHFVFLRYQIVPNILCLLTLKNNSQND